jgi:hypothetical protein
LKVLNSLIYTVILSIIHMLFCSDSRNRIQGPICKFSKVWGLNCNFPKLRDQTEILSSSTSNPEFLTETYCSLQIPNTISPFKQNHNSKSSSFNSISQNHPNNQIPTTINSITFKLNHQSNPKHKFHNPNIYQNQN